MSVELPLFHVARPCLLRETGISKDKNRELKKGMTTMASRMPPNKRFNQQINSCEQTL